MKIDFTCFRFIDFILYLILNYARFTKLFSEKDLLLINYENSILNLNILLHRIAVYCVTKIELNLGYRFTNLNIILIVFH